MKKILLATIGLFVMALPAHAVIIGDKSVPVTYSRTTIILNRKNPPPPPPAMPWQEDDDNVTPPPAQDNRLFLDIEMRDGNTLYNQGGWYNLASYDDKAGVMMAFNDGGMHPIIRSAQYAPVDILFIDKRGKITQIAPNILLSDLEEEIYPDVPVAAFLFLKGGRCAALSITPGDEIDHEFFKKSPTILNAPNMPISAPAASIRPVEEKQLKALPAKNNNLKLPKSPSAPASNAPLQNPFFEEKKP
jgi:uncharacterized membrane protein (UPF0127 family)